MDLSKGQQTANEMTDEQLLESFRMGNESSLALLMLRVKPQLKSKALSFAVSKSDCEDLEQEGWIAFLNAVRAYRPERGVPFLAFVSSCVKNAMITHYQKAIKGETELIPDQTDWGERFIDLAPNVNPEQTVLSAEYVEATLRQIKQSLSLLEFQVLVLFVQGQSYEERARRLNTDEKGISNALQRVRRKLKTGHSLVS